MAASGCTVGTGDVDSPVAAEEVGEAEQALWTCEGWTPALFQYCLTRCGSGSAWHPVGSETVVPYGTCTERAQDYCRDRGWGASHDVCWGYNY